MRVLLRGRLRLAFVIAFALARGAPLHAQRTPALVVTLPPAAQLAQIGPIVEARDMLSSEHTREPLASGFPARFHFVVTLWSEGRWGNKIERRAEYEVRVSFRAMDKKYEVAQIVNDRTLSLGRFDRAEDAEGAIARPTRVPIRAFPSTKKFYYQVTLDVESLGLSDLDEVNRWLRGEVDPAIHGARDPGTAITRSIRMLTSRVLGLETQYEARTPTFQVP